MKTSEVLVESSGPTETIIVEAAANSQSAQSVGANTDAGVIELFGIDWLVHLVHSSVSKRAVTRIEYMSLTEFQEISLFKVK